MKLNLYKIKPNKLKDWLNWGELLQGTYRIKALETLKDEDVILEAFGVFELDGENYTVGISLGKNNLPSDPNNQLNIKHKEIKAECLDFVKDIDIVYMLDNSK